MVVKTKTLVKLGVQNKKRNLETEKRMKFVWWWTVNILFLRFFSCSVFKQETGSIRMYITILTINSCRYTTNYKQKLAIQLLIINLLLHYFFSSIGCMCQDLVIKKKKKTVLHNVGCKEFVTEAHLYSLLRLKKGYIQKWGF